MRGGSQRDGGNGAGGGGTVCVCVYACVMCVCHHNCNRQASGEPVGRESLLGVLRRHTVVGRTDRQTGRTEMQTLRREMKAAGTTETTLKSFPTGRKAHQSPSFNRKLQTEG